MGDYIVVSDLHLGENMHEATLQQEFREDMPALEALSRIQLSNHRAYISHRRNTLRRLLDT